MPDGERFLGRQVWGRIDGLGPWKCLGGVVGDVGWGDIQEAEAGGLGRGQTAGDHLGAAQSHEVYAHRETS